MPIECAAVEHATLLDHTFDGVVAWGLLFLLAPDVQRRLIPRLAGALEPGGRLLFTAPAQACEWADVLTGRTSVSLGADAYRRLVEDAGLELTGEADDEGDNHYYFCRRPTGGA